MTSHQRLTLATSALALTVALAGGGGYAVAQGAHLPKNSVTSKTVKNDSLTGKDIKESTLGLVPQAATAQSAAVAASVSGFDVTRVRLTTDQNDQEIFDSPELQLFGSCGGGQVHMSGSNSVTGASLFTSMVDLDLHATHDGHVGVWTAGVIVDLLGGASPTQADPGLLTFQYTAPNGPVITGTLTSNSDGLHCTFAGTVTTS